MRLSEYIDRVTGSTPEGRVLISTPVKAVPKLALPGVQ